MSSRSLVMNPQGCRVIASSRQCRGVYASGPAHGAPGPDVATPQPACNHKVTEASVPRASRGRRRRAGCERPGKRPAHLYACPGLRLIDLDIVREARDHREREPRRHQRAVALLTLARRACWPAGVDDLDLEAAFQVRQRDPDRFGGALRDVGLDRPGAGLTDGQPHLVHERLGHSAAPGDGRRHQPGSSHVGRQRREADLNGCHLCPPDPPSPSPPVASIDPPARAPGRVRPLPYFSDFLCVMARSTVSWIPKTLVSPVMRKILSIRSCVHTRSSDPSWARTRLSPPTSTPRPVESRNSTFSMFTISW